MSPLPGLAKRSEKGFLTPGSCLVGCIDLQPRMLAALANFAR